jgi:tetratricopeptide (TPR) repeat protein
LELVFEHRNYLPSLFIFLPFSAFIYRFQKQAYKNKRGLFLFSNVFVVFIMVSMGLITYTRNMDWQTEKTLWEDVLRKYPNSTRAMHNLAYGHYQRKGDYDSALILYQLILSKDWHDGSADFRKGLTLNNMAFIYFLKGLDETALKLWNQALLIHPQLKSAKIGKIRALIGLGRWPEAIQAVGDAALDGKFPEVSNLKAFILFKQGYYNEAIPYLQKTLQNDPLNTDSMIYLAAIFSKLERYGKSKMFLHLARSIKRHDVKISLMLLENSILMEDHRAIKKHLALILNPSLREQVLNALRNSQKKDGIPLRLEKIIPQIASEADSYQKKWVDSIEALISDTDA